MKRMLTTLAVMAVLISVSAAPGLAEVKNGPLVFGNYSDLGNGPLYKFDPVTRRVGEIDVTGNVTGRYPDVTPDGQTVVYSYENSIYSVPIDGGAAPTRLTPADPNNSTWAEYPAVSPSGDTVYFQRYGSDGTGIYSVPIEGGDIKPVIQTDTDSYEQHFGLQITPDGENFVYRDSIGRMYVRPVGGGPANILYDGCRHDTYGACGYPTVSPDGTKVAFTDGYAIYTIPFSTTGGGTPTKVPGSEAGRGSAGFFSFDLWIDGSVSFSPDGRYIAYNALKPENEVGDCGVGYCGYSETRWIPVDGGTYSRVNWRDFVAATQVVWAPAPDSTEPVTTAAPSPRPNKAGWNNSDVTVTLRATDADGGSGVEKITYSASGAQTIEQTDGTGRSVEVKIDQEGTTTLTYFATDEAGNDEAPQTLEVKIDKTPPSVFETTPSNYATGVPATNTIWAYFDEGVAGLDTNTLTADTFRVVQVKPTGNTPVEGTVGSFEGYPQPVYFTPTSSLPKGLYRATLTTGVKDIAGNALADEYTWTFATAGRTAR